MQNFNFDNVITTGSGTIYTCLDNGAPVRPIEPEDEGYPADPELLYLWNYRSTIIVSCSITNNDVRTIKATINIVKPDPVTIPVIYNIEVPAGGTMVVIGGDHKVFLEYEDALESVILNAVDPALVSITTSIMNIYDYGHIPPIKVVLPYYGDTGMTMSGESNMNKIDKIDIVNSTIQADFATSVWYIQGRSSGSNSIDCIVSGGYSNYDHMEVVPFATFAGVTGWGTLYDATGYHNTISDGTQLINGGGYDRQTALQINYFDTGGAAVHWGDLAVGRTYVIAANNSVYGLWMGGWNNTDDISYSEFSSGGTTSTWGTVTYNLYLYRGAAAGNEVMALACGDSYGYANVHKIEFASQANASYFGPINNGNYIYENGSVANDTKVIFFGDERYYNRLWEVDFAAEYSTTYWGDITGSGYDGGNPAGSSGNG